MQFTPAARRQLKKLNKGVQVQIVQALEGLAVAPRPAGVKKLKGNDGFYRIRVGDYRIIYQINDGKLIILVVLIGNRRDVYDQI